MARGYLEKETLGLIAAAIFGGLATDSCRIGSMVDMTPGLPESLAGHLDPGGHVDGAAGG